MSEGGSCVSSFDSAHKSDIQAIIFDVRTMYQQCSSSTSDVLRPRCGVDVEFVRALLPGRQTKPPDLAHKRLNLLKKWPCPHRVVCRSRSTSRRPHIHAFGGLRRSIDAHRRRRYCIESVMIRAMSVVRPVVLQWSWRQQQAHGAPTHAVFAQLARR